MMPGCLDRYLRSGAELTSGLVVWNVTDYAFDYALYPFVVWKLGPVVGGGIMALASLVFCLVLLRIYDGLRRDWLGIEFVKGLRHYDGPSRWRRGLAWLISRGDGIAFVILSAKSRLTRRFALPVRRPRWFAATREISPPSP